MRNYDQSITKWLNKHDWILLEKINFPEKINSREELLLGIMLALWIAKKEKEIETLDDFSKAIRFHFSHHPSPDLYDFILKIIDTVKNDTNFLKIKDLNEKWLANDYYGTWIQHSLDNEKRKKFAANYTSRVDKLIDFVLPETLKLKSIVDPFAGSGRLITSIIRKYPNNKLNKIMINDFMPVALLLGYCRVIHEMAIHNIKAKLIAHIKDGFSLQGKYSLVIMNPPFTRSQLISDPQKELLQPLISKYSQFNQGQGGLHLWAIYLANELIQKGGLILSIIPTSTILSRYSKGIQELILDNYSQLKIISSASYRSYSEDSDVRELVLCITNRNEDGKFQFSLVTEGKNWSYFRKNEINRANLRNDWNWDRYFRPSSLLKIRNELLNDCKLLSGKEAELSIKRGIEMYGPNFFFFPNKKWNIREKDKVMLVYDKKNLISLPSDQFEKILRKPVLYTKFITPKINDYALAINQNTHIPNIDKYIELNFEETEIAKKRFGSSWINHIHTQLHQKQPYGHLFLIDKYGINTASVLCHYTDEKYPCTKNFYVIQLEKFRSKLLAAWLNSTLFLALYLSSRREIGGTYGRMQIIDIQEEPLFPNKLLKIPLSSKKIEKIFELFDEVRYDELSSIPMQLLSKNRIELDTLIAKLIGYKGNMEQLHMDVKLVIDELLIRDKTKSKR